jgi:hypothetical protein
MQLPLDPQNLRHEQLETQLRDELRLLQETEQRWVVETRPLERDRLRIDSQQVRNAYQLHLTEWEAQGYASGWPGRWFHVPFARNPLFTGREDVLLRLHDALQEGRAALTQVISGLGGIGKTQTALEYAYRHRNDYQAILWTGAADRATLEGGFVEIAQVLALPEKDAPERSATVAAVQRWLRDHTGWLLIADNTDDPAVLKGVLPPGAQGHLLLTCGDAAGGGAGVPAPKRRTRGGGHGGADSGSATGGGTGLSAAGAGAGRRLYRHPRGALRRLSARLSPPGAGTA